MAKYEEGLGRVMFVTGALEHERPFMAPLYKFMIIHPRHSVQAMPSYVLFFLRFLARQVEQRRHYLLAQCRLSRRRQHREWTRRLRQREQGLEAGFPQCDQTARCHLWTSRWSGAEARKLAVGV